MFIILDPKPRYDFPDSQLIALRGGKKVIPQNEASL